MFNYKRGDFVYYVSYNKEPVLCRIIDFIKNNYPTDIQQKYYDSEIEYILVPVTGHKQEIWAFASELGEVETSPLVSELYGQ